MSGKAAVGFIIVPVQFYDWTQLCWESVFAGVKPLDGIAYNNLISNMHKEASWDTKKHLTLTKALLLQIDSSSDSDISSRLKCSKAEQY